MKWRTRAGEIIDVKDMQTSHIENSIAMLKRTLANRPDPYIYGEPTGEMAQDAFHAEIRHNDQVEEALRKDIAGLEAELKARSA